MTGTTADLAATTGIDVPTGLLIGGQWTKGRDGGLIPVTDPATEEAIAEVADATAEDALDAVSAAQAALPGLGGDPAPRARRVPPPRLGADDRAVRSARPADGPGEREGPAGRAG